MIFGQIPLASRVFFAYKDVYGGGLTSVFRGLIKRYFGSLYVIFGGFPAVFDDGEMLNF